MNQKTHKPFHFKQFKLNQEFAAMKIGADGILLGAWANCQDYKHIIDVGTGTGVIALMLAQKNINAKIDAVEIDHNAIKDAKRNFETSPWKKRLTLIHENFSKWNNKRKYDLIISNPPFFKNSLKPNDYSRAIAKHVESLNSKSLSKFASNQLSSNGKLCLIAPFDQLNETKIHFLENHFHFSKVCLVKPKPYKEPHRVLLEFKREKTEPSVHTIVIENDNRHEYSDDYKKLTREFYTIF